MFQTAGQTAHGADDFDPFDFGCPDEPKTPPPPARPSRRPSRSLEDIDALTFEEPEWLVPDLLPLGGEAFCIAHPGEGKSFVAVDLALTVAGAFPTWHGRPVQHGGVVYIAGERPAEVEKRIAAFRKRHGRFPGRFRLVEHAVQVADEADVEAFLDDECRLVEPVLLVVVDTLSRCCDGSENDDEVAKGFMAGVQRIRDETGAAVLILCHPRKGSTGYVAEEPAGSRVFRASADNTFTVTAEVTEGSKLLRLTVTPAKTASGPQADPFVLETAEQYVGHGRKSLVIRHDVEPQATSKRRGRRAKATGEASGKPTPRKIAEVFTSDNRRKAMAAIKKLERGTAQEIGRKAGCDPETARRAMVENAGPAGLVTLVPGTGTGKGNPAIYELTELGRLAS